MDILCIIPPYIPSYFNAGHHLAVFQVAEYLRKRTNLDVCAIDGAALNLTWKETCDLLIQKPKLIALMNDFDGVDTFDRFVRYVKRLSPDSKIITFGRLSKQATQFFLKYNIDAVHCHGDYESGVYDYWCYLNHLRNDAPGTIVKNALTKTPSKGCYLPAEEWCLPDITDIPYGAYHSMYLNDMNKFCGIPGRQELVLPVARGCSIGCFFCDVPKMQGKLERRLTVETTIKYIETSFLKSPFEYVSFYAPTFTLNKRWVHQLCDSLLKLKRLYPWKCTTALSCLDEGLVRVMGDAGCFRISLGIETISGAQVNLPKTKQHVQDKFETLLRICKEKGIEINAFIILGLPGDDPNDVEKTIQMCHAHGVRVRPTIYTPYHLMPLNIDDISEIASYNRQTFVEGLLSQEMTDAYYQLFYNNKNDKPTQIMDKITKVENCLLEVKS